MRWIIWKILLPLLLAGADGIWLKRSGAWTLEGLKSLGVQANSMHFPLGQLNQPWANFLIQNGVKEGWALSAPMVLNTLLAGLILGWWLDWRLSERALGRRGPVDSIMRGFGDPRGPLLGSIIAAVMNRGNKRINRYCVDALDLESEDQVLDLGFGGGVSFPMVLAKLGVGSLTAIDASADMLTRARKKYQRQAASGRLVLMCATADKMPLRDRSMDKVLTVNSIYFWTDLTAGLKEIRRVLRPQGVLALGIRPQEVMGKFRDWGFRAYSERQIAGALYKAGFQKIEVEDRPDGKMGAKIFRAWGQRQSQLISDSDVESLIDDLESQMGTMLDVEI